LVVEDLRQVAAATVGKQHHDDVAGRRRRGRPRGGPRGEPARAADQQRFLTSQPARHPERLGVADRDDLVTDVLVVGLRPDVLAYTLDQVGPPAAAGVHRTFGVGAHDPHPAAGDLLQVPAGARDRAARPDPGHEVGDLPLGLLPDLRAGRLVVRAWVVGVRVLVWLPAAL